MQQFIANLTNVGIENLPTDPVKYVDSGLLERAMSA
jgi:hypothetical protein